MRTIKFIMSLLVAATFIYVVYSAVSFFVDTPTAQARSALYDQWAPVTRSSSVTSTDVTKWFEWTGTVQFIGAGLDDETVAGTFTGHREMVFIAEIEDAAANPDEFMWSSDGGHNWTTGVAMTGAPQTLTEGVTIAFAAVNGHTNRDRWTWVEHCVGHSDVAAVAFTGSGLNDATSGGTYTGHTLKRYRVQVEDATQNPDTFRWSDDAGVSWEETGLDMAVAAYHLSNGVTILWAAVNGHTDDEYWDIIATPASQQLVIGSINWTVTASHAGDFVLFKDSEGENQFGILSGATATQGEFIYDPPVYLPIGRDLLMDTTSTTTMIIYFNVNAWLRDVNY